MSDKPPQQSNPCDQATSSDEALKFTKRRRKKPPLSYRNQARKIATTRERIRANAVTEAIEELRQILPLAPGVNATKHGVVKFATNYIHHLKTLLAKVPPEVSMFVDLFIFFSIY